jgi:hypothetical protein
VTDRIGKAAYRLVAGRPHFSTEGAICRVERYLVRLIRPGAFEDRLTEILRGGAGALLAQAVEADPSDEQPT